MIRLVAAWASVGPLASLRASSRERSSNSASGQTVLTTPQSRSVLGGVQVAGHDELARPRRAGALGEPLRAAHRRRQPDAHLHQAELRALGGQSRSQASAISRPHVRHSACAANTTGNGRSSMLLHELEPAAPQLGAALGRQALEDVDVHPAGPRRGPRRAAAGRAAAPARRGGSRRAGPSSTSGRTGSAAAWRSSGPRAGRPARASRDRTAVMRAAPPRPRRVARHRRPGIQGSRIVSSS